ncbi:hypothetical protein L1987_65950 [Smallanthus sonchifolius]|uniref:Uncharacterized protein n=1 Tax=Smallanthus sonchifolius TaxID=185202 RepID=A0ACB9BW04_9ASTR|nr:hypothetical protein L1987_65950 [Smallanthus sonchifolius]
MSRVHPSSENKSGSHRLQCDNHDALPVAVSSCPKHTTLTVWKRSSMSFQGTDGFTVYDRQGRLAFRVDNYSRKNGWSCSSRSGAALVLMDGSGKPLLTLKPQIFSFQSQWNGCIYIEDDYKSFKNRTIFVMRRPSSTLFVFSQQVQCEAEVYLTEPEANEGFKKTSPPPPDYRIEGSFWNRNCKIMSTASGEVAAKIIRKRTCTPTMVSSSSTMVLSEEVFSLVVKPGFDPQLIMAFVVILDRICFKPFFTPLMCS